jgi:ribosome-binding protein aMBF1 (putative translation factor)
MMKNEKNKMIDWEEHLDKKYGKKGTSTRNKYEEEFESFKIGVLIQEARKQRNMTQSELAEKVGTQRIIFPGSKMTQVIFALLL